VIIPGTKNTIADLRWLLQRGFRKVLEDTLERDGWVLGICGGFQMLGRKVSDPYETEEGGVETGLGFLPVETELEKHKITVQSKGRSFLGEDVTGYEIHMGRTRQSTPLDPFILKEDGSRDGVLCGHVAATYFHGLFENAHFTRKFLTRIAESRRLQWRPGVVQYSKDQEYDRLATVVREHLDMERIEEIIRG
jgi:adenosylcobyric acid synthase